MGLNPLCHGEITFVTGVPGRPIHRLVDCRPFRMWNGFGTTTCLFSNKKRKKKKNSASKDVESILSFFLGAPPLLASHRPVGKATPSVVWVNVRRQRYGRSMLLPYWPSWNQTPFVQRPHFLEIDRQNLPIFPFTRRWRGHFGSQMADNSIQH